MAARRLSERQRYPELIRLRVPEGRPVRLAGRGTTWVREVPGPAGAPVLMLLHGLSATGALNWAPAFAALSEHYRVVALDHRGHGRGIRSTHFRLVDCADDVAALADQLGVDRFAAVGYSMGGPIAQLTWRRHRDRVSGLVLCATARDFGGRLSERGRLVGMGVLGAGLGVVPAGVGRAGWAAVSRVFTAEMTDPRLRDWTAEELRGNDARLVLEAAGELGRFTSRGWIGSVDVPTAVIATRRDQLVPFHRQLKLAAAVPGAVVEAIDADHFAITRAPDAFVAALVRACARATRGSLRPTSRPA